MKKILLATTILVGTAGFAAAEVTLSGDARMGITKSEGGDAVFSNRARVKFTLSGETDGGLTFGASFRAADAGYTRSAGDDGIANNDDDVITGGAAAGAKGTVSLSGAFGTLSMGDESAAIEYAVGDLAMKSFAGVGDSNETTFISSSKVVYTYAAGDLSAYLSTGQTGSDDSSIGVSYTTGGLTVGAGWETTGTVDHAAASASYAMGDTTVKGVYGTASELDFTQMGLSVSHTAGAISVAAFYRTTETGAVDADYSGVGVSYDLGGGASVNSGVADVNGSTRMDAGVNFTF